MADQPEKTVRVVRYRLLNKDEQKKDRDPGQNRSRLFPVLMKLMIVLFTLFFLFFVVFGLIRVRGASMDPLMKDGDLLVVYRLKKELKTGDAAAFRADGKTYVARVVAGPGQTVDITSEGLLIDGKKSEETYGYGRTERFQNGIEYPVVLGKNEYFLLGDDRALADDSRIFGKIGRKSIIGVAAGLFRRRGF